MLQASSSSLVDLKALFASCRYVLASTVSPVRLSAYSGEDVKSAFSGECSKFAGAAVETLNGICREQTFAKHQAWPSIRLYYAAFYSAHLLLRMHGRACVYIEGPPLAGLNQVARLSGGTISGGLYKVAEDRNFSLTFTSIKDSHKDTWKCLFELIEDLENELIPLSAPKSDKDDAVILLGRIKNKISPPGVGSGYLSNFRNKVQYQFEKSTWYPFGANIPKSFDINKHTNAASRGDYKGFSGASEIAEFFDSCLFISSTALSLFNLIMKSDADLHDNLTRYYAPLRSLSKAGAPS